MEEAAAVEAEAATEAAAAAAEEAAAELGQQPQEVQGLLLIVHGTHHL